MDSVGAMDPREQARLKRHLRFAGQLRRSPWRLKAIWTIVVLIPVLLLVSSAWNASEAFGLWRQLDGASEMVGFLALTNAFWVCVCKSTLHLAFGATAILMMPMLAQQMRDHRLIVKLHAQASRRELGEPAAESGDEHAG